MELIRNERSINEDYDNYIVVANREYTSLGCYYCGNNHNKEKKQKLIMRKKLKHIIAMLSIFACAFSGTTSYANNITEHSVEIDELAGHDFANDNTIVINGDMIDKSKLITFNSREEAIEFFTNQLNASALCINSKDKLPQKSVASVMSTVGNQCIDQQAVSFGASINLFVSYTTSGDHNTGSITSHNAYTTFSGFTYSFGWEEKYCSSWVTDSGKDIQAVASGDLVFYFLVNNVIEYYRTTVNLSGMCLAIKLM